ncbi:hypothetical protein FOT62_22925 [Serratia marcescens]|uniref:Phosphoenolpyruvate synthase n=1 Tax=Serratia marcescens TaxID=615 RepID=A0A5C7BRY9_SERMA|nr:MULTISPECIES: PEP/pyruvate-binding domain-containing protein [Serratia]TXE27171.1 hypothetical protein FOT62_22925 [Serratia marcescens]TXE55272.1 hypothetical protein FOT56_25240 [Serratia marcescens]
MPNNFHILIDRHVLGNKAYNLTKMKIAGLPIPEGFVILFNETPSIKEIINWYNTYIVKGSVSVRSSSNKEDGETKSGAGFYKTKLNIPLQRIQIAIKIVRQQADKEGKIPVIIQQYIHAMLSGVAYSINPKNGMDDIYMEYGHGPCDDVVAGRIIPKSLVVKKNEVCHHKEIPHKLVEYIIQLELLFGMPVDVEWCIDHSGKIWILQCRPITVIPSQCYQYA